MLDMIIAFSGKVGSGKTFVAEVIHAQLNMNKKKYKLVSFATPLKYHCARISKKIINIHGDKSQETGLGCSYGQLLQEEGQRLKFNDPYLFVRETLENNPGNIVIDDMRFKKEKEFIENSGRPYIFFRLNYNVCKNDTRNMNDISEVDLDDVDFLYSTNLQYLKDIIQLFTSILYDNNIIDHVYVVDQIVQLYNNNNHINSNNSKTIIIDYINDSRDMRIEKLTFLLSLLRTKKIEGIPHKKVKYVVLNPPPDAAKKLKEIILD